MFKTESFTRQERVKRSEDIKNLFKKGSKIGIKGAKLFYSPNNFETNRVVFALPRGYGNAVERNYSKRLSREAYRLFKTHLNTSYDLLFLIYPGNDSFLTRCVQIRTLCKKAGLTR